MMTREQSRAARAWLGWTQQDLAARANVSLCTVKAFETGKGPLVAQNLSAMYAAFTSHGIRMEFHSDGTPKGITARDGG
jgi:DNA-binding XRE family transcriptional regulator